MAEASRSLLVVLHAVIFCCYCCLCHLYFRKDPHVSGLTCPSGGPPGRLRVRISSPAFHKT